MYEIKKLDSKAETNVILGMELSFEKLEEGCQSLKLNSQNKRITEIIEGYYNLGKVAKVIVLSGGYTNRNYQIELEDGNSYFLRQYISEKEEKEILYEHALLAHIKQQGFKLNAIPIDTRDGKKYFKEFIDGEEKFFALSNFLDGDNTYNWEYNEVSPNVSTNVAEVTAKFHLATQGFNPPKEWANNEPIMREQLKYYASNIRKFTKKISENPDTRLFTEYLNSKLDYLENTINNLLKIFEYDNEFVKIVIHTDLHPGNFKYKGEEVVALFDFDWPKVDVRLYETAISAMFFSCSWKSECNGALDFDILSAYISSYNKTLQNMGGSLAPMTKTELKFLPEMMMIGSLYPVHYCINKCANESGINIFEFFYYTLHQIRCIEWIEENIEKIREVCTK